MSVMCSLAVCKAQQGMCGHEKAMLSVAACGRRPRRLFLDRLKRKNKSAFILIDPLRAVVEVCASCPF